MRRIIFTLILASLFAVNVTGCSLFGSSDDEKETAEVAENQEGGDEFEGEDSAESGDEEEAGASEEGGDEFADEGAEASEGGDEVAATDSGEFEVEEGLGNEDDEYPDDDFSGGGAKNEEIAEVSDDDFAPEGGEEDSFAVDEGQSGEQDLPAEPMSSNEEQDLFAQEESSGDSAGSFYEPAAPSAGYSDVGAGAGFVSVKKMKPAAFRRAGANVNRLYVVRAGESMADVSQKIYSSDRTNDLYTWNGHFKNKKVKPGDKVYYSSAVSPNDPEMKTYYEDNGIPPQYYTSQKGENIRGIAKKLLGNERSWMELYATNPSIDSKWALPAGTQMRYWGEGAPAMAAKPAPVAAPEPEMAAAEPMPVEPEEVADIANPEEIPPADPSEVQDVANLDEPAEPDSGDINEISDVEEFSPPPTSGSVAPPPPPPSNAMTPPPPPPAPLAQNAKPFKKPNKSGVGQDDSKIMGALGGLLILAAIILLIFIRRSRAKRVNFSQTQV